jgi:hypothetical protein|tara:strand:+ start:2730 stop:2906 length:177 start_codon:yes stop_codon:yes gene_type:complete
VKKHNLILAVIFIQLLTFDTLEANTIEDTRIKMLNGEYAKLLDFNSDGPMIINFWTTW